MHAPALVQASEAYRHLSWLGRRLVFSLSPLDSPKIRWDRSEVGASLSELASEMIPFLEADARAQFAGLGERLLKAVDSLEGQPSPAAELLLSTLDAQYSAIVVFPSRCGDLRNAAEEIPDPIVAAALKDGRIRALVLDNQLADFVESRSDLTVRALGSPVNFPPHILTAPRARETVFLAFSGPPHMPPIPTLFPGGSPSWMAQLVDVDDKRWSVAGGLPQVELVEHFDTEEQEALPSGLELAVAITSLVRESRAPAERDQPDDEVGARVLYLVNGFVAFVRDDPAAKVQVLQASAGTLKFRQVPAADVEPGMILVRRSEGADGDLLRAIADQILGSEAAELRTLQADYKMLLMTKVDRLGVALVEEELRTRGMSVPHVRYRLSPESIRTDSPDDFIVLMRYLGESDRAAHLWNAMGRLQQAHKQAGQLIRRTLETRVSQSPEVRQALLEGNGVVEFSDEDLGGAALRLWLVEGVEEPQTPAHRIPSAALSVVQPLSLLLRSS